MRLLPFAIAIAICTGFNAPAFAQQSSSGIPACSSGDPVVWVNTNTRKYHMQGDSYYGKTKQGKYLCKSAADAAGDKAAKTSSSRAAGAGDKAAKTSSSRAAGAMEGTNMNAGTTRAPMSSGAAPGTNMNPDSAPSAVPSAGMGHHKHHHMSSGATQGTNMNTDDSAASPEPSAPLGHKRRHHKKMDASPSPDMTPSPAAS